MKNKNALLAFLTLLAALTTADQASAQTGRILLFQDTFNTAGTASGGTGATGINGTARKANDQTGTNIVVPMNYGFNSSATSTFVKTGITNTTIAGGGASLFFNGGTIGGTNGQINVGSSYNFANLSNSLPINSRVLQFSFNITVTNGTTANGTYFGLGNSATHNVASANDKFNSFFLAGGSTSQSKNGVTTLNNSIKYNNGDTISFIVSDGTGSGWAFSNDNGANDQVQMFINNSWAQTFTGLNFGTTDGFLTFQTKGVDTYIDNLIVTAIPEPASALLTGLGALSIVIILHRRRAKA